ncbi:hypothetical protein [Plantibacter sp. YIM 135249]|uniref:hypothetical protein n=1 Tax=Plantibacter sp. YIM 135249 TaxID=3423918 RepID=UPI003D32DEB9
MSGPPAVVLSACILDELRRYGIATEFVADLSVPLDEWGAIAVATAPDIGRSVFTFRHDGYVSALVEGWPATRAERASLSTQLAALGFPDAPDRSVTSDTSRRSA